jgi:phospho-N-acetylmuramoyl-pentapeptide-transferase
MEVFTQLIRILITALFSFVAAMLLVSPIDRLIRKLKAGKHIAKDAAPIFSELHAQKEGTPVMAGIIIWGSTVLTVLIFWLFSLLFDGFWSEINILDRSQTYLPLAGFILAALVGAGDDIIGILKIKGKKGLSVKERFLLYAGIGLLAAWWFAQKLHWDVLHVPFVGNVFVGALGYAIFVFLVVIATSHSTNLTNGLDGLAEGVSLIALTCLTVVAFVLGRYDLAALTASIIGGLIAFLWFNIYPARFFMGDTGSMSLGVVIALIALLTNTGLFLLFFSFILVVESLSVILQTFSKKVFKKKIFISTPIHHHFEAKGWLEPQITMRFWIVSGIAAVMGLVLFFVDWFLLR